MILFICEQCGRHGQPSMVETWDSLGKAFSDLGKAFKMGVRGETFQSEQSLPTMDCPVCQIPMREVKPEDRLMFRGETKTPLDLATLPFRQHNGDEEPEPDVARRHITIVQWRCSGCKELLQTTERNQQVKCQCGKQYRVEGPWSSFFGDPVTVHEVRDGR